VICLKTCERQALFGIPKTRPQSFHSKRSNSFKATPCQAKCTENHHENDRDSSHKPAHVHQQAEKVCPETIEEKLRSHILVNVVLRACADDRNSRDNVPVVVHEARRFCVLRPDSFDLQSTLKSLTKQLSVKHIFDIAVLRAVHGAPADAPMQESPLLHTSNLRNHNTLVAYCNVSDMLESAWYFVQAEIRRRNASAQVRPSRRMQVASHSLTSEDSVYSSLAAEDEDAHSTLSLKMNGHLTESYSPVMTANVQTNPRRPLVEVQTAAPVEFDFSCVQSPEKLPVLCHGSEEIQHIHVNLKELPLEQDIYCPSVPGPVAEHTTVYTTTRSSPVPRMESNDTNHSVSVREICPHKADDATLIRLDTLGNLPGHTLPSHIQIVAQYKNNTEMHERLLNPSQNLPVPVFTLDLEDLLADE
jgi:hypothetical protein